MEKQQSKKPLIRFPEFKDAWEHKRLNELLSEAKKRNEDLKYGKDEVLSVSGELGIVNQIEHLGRSYAGVSVHQYHVVEVGDIVYTKSPLKANPFGIIKLNKGKAGIVSTLYAVYKVNKQTAYGPFIDYYFSLDANTNRYLRPLVRKGAKNTLQVTNEEAISAEIFTPTIPEQKRIASFFTVLDKKIAELKQKKNLLEQYKKGVTQKIFTQELRFKDDSDKDFPEWEKFKITQIAETSIGLVTTMTTSYVEFGVPLIRNSDIKENRIEKSQLIYLDETFATKHKHKKLKTGDIVTVHTGLIGVSAVIDETMNGCLGFATLNTRVNRDLVIPEFICIYYNTPTYINYAISVATGDGRSNYNLKDFDKAIIPVPSLKEQVKILNFLNNIDFKLNNCRLRIEQIELFKKGLLQNMFI
jgi:type I restriction enzyme S subunit